MESIKYIDLTEEELESISETKEEMKESIEKALKSETMSNEIKKYIEDNFASEQNPNNKEYSKFVLGLLNGKNDDFKVLIKIIIVFTSEDHINKLMSKKLIRNNFAKGELETYANNIQFDLYFYDDRKKYFDMFINPSIIFIKNVFNKAMLPFIINPIDKNLLDDFDYEKYNNSKEKINLFFKKIYTYVYKAINKEIDKELLA